MHFSYGSFGFWTAFLKHQKGDVILAKGTSKTPTFLEKLVSQFLPNWTFLQDPCYEKDKSGNPTMVHNCL